MKVIWKTRTTCKKEEGFKNVLETEMSHLSKCLLKRNAPNLKMHPHFSVINSNKSPQHLFLRSFLMMKLEILWWI